MVKKILFSLLLATVGCASDDSDEPQPPQPTTPDESPPVWPVPPELPQEPDLPPEIPPDIPDFPPIPTEEIAKLYLLINGERASRSLPILSTEEALSCASQRHADDIGPRRMCSHAGGDSSSFVDRVEACGFQMVSGSEIIACGHRNPREAVNGWLASPGHRAAMLDAQNRSMGAAVVNNYWVVVFSK